MARTLALLLALAFATPAFAQVGKSLGVVDANTTSEADLAAMPGMTPAIAKALVAARPFDRGKRMAREFAEYRPWKSHAQFEKEIGKYVDAREVKRLWRYVVIQ